MTTLEEPTTTTPDPDEIQDKVLVKQDIDRTYDELRDSVADHADGLFGPDSMLWKVLEPLPVLPFMLIQAGLLEAPVPKIWFGTENSITRSGDFASRYARSYDAFSDWFCGDVQTALRTGRRIHGYHSRITGKAPVSLGHVHEGQRYAATEQQLMVLTWGTQIVPIHQFYEMLERPLTPRENELYYEDCKRFAKVFGIDVDTLPPTWDDFLAYWDAALHSGEMQLADGGFDRFGPLYDQSLLGWKSKWIVKWIMTVQFNLLPEVIRAQFEAVTPLAKKRPRFTKATCAGFKLFYKALPGGMHRMPRIQAAQVRAGVGAPSTRTERWVARKMPHPFGEAQPSLNIPASADADPKNSGAFSIPSR